MSYGLLGLSGMTVRSESSRRPTSSEQGWAGGSSVLLERQEGEQLAHRLERRLLGVEGEVGHAGAGGVGLGAAQVLLGDLLVRHRPDHVRPGDEHVGGVLHHEDEVGDGRAVDRPAGAGAEDDRDLRDHAGGQGVAEEDVGVAGQRDHALLDARAAGVVEADDRAADLHGPVHHLADLLGEGAGERAAEDGEVLGEHEDLAPLHQAVAGDHAVAQVALRLHPEVGAAVGLELVQLHERARVEEQVDPLARGQLAGLVLPGDPLLAAALLGLCVELVQACAARIGVHGLWSWGPRAEGAAGAWRPPIPRERNGSGRPGGRYSTRPERVHHPAQARAAAARSAGAARRASTPPATGPPRRARPPPPPASRGPAGEGGEEPLGPPAPPVLLPPGEPAAGRRGRTAAA